MYGFYRTDSNVWYIDLPEWDGDQRDLQMVEGADTLLDMLSLGTNDIIVYLDDKPFDGASVLIKKDEDREGAYYHVDSINSKTYNMDIWLCEVTLFVFNSLPDKIYVKV